MLTVHFCSSVTWRLSGCPATQSPCMQLLAPIRGLAFYDQQPQCFATCTSAALRQTAVLCCAVVRTIPYCWISFKLTEHALLRWVGQHRPYSSQLLSLQVGSGQSLVERVREARGVADMQALVDSEQFTPNHICEALHCLAHQCDPVRTGPDFYFAQLIAACTKRNRNLLWCTA